MSPERRHTSTIRRAACSALLLAALGCSAKTTTVHPPKPSHVFTSASASPRPSSLAAEAACRPDHPEKWQSTPLNFFNSSRIAQRLKVPLSYITQGGRFGDATCDKSLSVGQIESTAPPIVSVAGEGSPCLVIGILKDPRQTVTTRQILALCANNPAEQQA